jgi:hypothetical protein
MSAQDEALFAPFAEGAETDLKHAIGELLDKKNAALTTELHNPNAITVLEVLGALLPGASAKVIKAFVEHFKVNMIAYQRKRAQEAIQMARAAQGREAELNERVKKSMLEVLTR